MNRERILLHGDVHANDPALRAIFAHASRTYAGERYQIWSLGDLVGRGPHPSRAWGTLMDMCPDVAIVGNHDWGLTGASGNVNVNAHRPNHLPHYSGPFNATDWEIILRHRRETELVKRTYWFNGQQMDGTIADYLDQLPVVAVPRTGIYLLHGGMEKAFEPPDKADKTLWHDLVWGYVKTEQHARQTVAAIHWLAQQQPKTPAVWRDHRATWQPPRLIVVAHTHRRRLYRHDVWESVHPETTYELSLTDCALVGVGSVGFSADLDDRNANYALLTLEDDRATIVYHSVPYNRHTVVQQMRDLRYPQTTINRLLLPSERVGVTADER